ncbi:MAG: S1 RNA-binding domain-containing protein [Chloroflexi bacterium]|nr:S1 RNA-binding domain-containing protein [Chloroflexota bacterium]
MAEHKATSHPWGDESPGADGTHPMYALLDEALNYKRPRRGEVLNGVVVSVSPSEITVDVGAKSEGIVSGRELEQLDPEIRTNLRPGDPVVVFVVSPEDREGNILLSIRRAQLEKDWAEAQRIYERGEIFEGTVSGYNRGGLLVRLGKVRGFVPASQLVSVDFPRGEGADVEHSEALKQVIGRKMQLKIVDLDRNRNRLILSERAAQREWKEERREKLLAELKVGDICHGKVTSLCDFGLFVDLGGIEGLVHMSELSWERVEKVSDVHQIGDEVEVYVMGVDQERGRIALSLKRLQPEPWCAIEQRYQVGQLVEGATITKLTSFGAFARLDDGIEGLIHISELSPERINHPREVVKEGDVLTLRVIRIDSARRRLGLSLRRVIEEAEAGLKASEVEGEDAAES